MYLFFFFSSRRRHTRFKCDWSSDVCSSDLGPTETTIWSATSRVEAGDVPVTIGPPIHNTSFYVLDANQQPLPIGGPGELYIDGPSVPNGLIVNVHSPPHGSPPNTLTHKPTPPIHLH